MTNDGPVLVVGGTGMLGGHVVTALLSRDKRVPALVRPASDAARLEQAGVEIARGDMMDPASLPSAMDGADAVITTAAGYTRHSGVSDRADRRDRAQDPRRQVSNRPVYVAMGISVDGERDVLGLWAGPTGGEGAKQWMTMLTELRNRGVVGASCKMRHHRTPECGRP
jgi:uncharacterized protein YbjT (DUF2867 family)